jgi:hypothetical protein
MKCAKDGCGGQPTLLAGSQLSPVSIALGGGSVYWIQSDTSTVMQCAAGGCGGHPTPMGTGAGCMGGQACQGVVADASSVYWITTDAVVACPAAGCGGDPTTLASNQEGSYGIAVDATNVYWAVNGDVLACAISGCGGNPTKLASLQGAIVLGITGGNVYWTYPGQPACQGEPATSSRVLACVGAACGSAPTMVATGSFWPAGFAADAENAYWTNYADPCYTLGTGNVQKCAISGCGAQPATFASGQDFPLAIAVDATSVYWTTDGGDTILKRTPK